MFWSCNFCICLEFGDTKRTHFVLLSNALEKDIGERNFQRLKSQFKGKILPPLHPESVRVQKISQEIIQALQKGLRKEDEILWVQKGQETEHFKWEVIVVNEPIVNAFCLPGRKIVVYTGLLNHFQADAEIATIIGHEVGHAVARHHAEEISMTLWLLILQLILYQFLMPDVVNRMSNLLLRLPFSRRMEMEADYIGLLLIASAGYDPRVAPQVYEKLEQIGDDGATLPDYLSTHPSGNMRPKLLSHGGGPFHIQGGADAYHEARSRIMHPSSLHIFSYCLLYMNTSPVSTLQTRVYKL